MLRLGPRSEKPSKKIAKEIDNPEILEIRVGFLKESKKRLFVP